MKVIAATAFGPVDHLAELEMPIPEPGHGQVRIRVHAASFNPVDYKRRRGAFGGDLPLVLGMDVAGVVDAVGAEVYDFLPGDKVWCFLAHPANGIGGYAEHVCSSASFVAPLPNNLNLEQAATLPVAGLTALECVHHHAQVKAGVSALVTGAAGGVGSFTIPLLRHLEAGPILATAGSDESAAYLQSMGIEPDHILNYRQLAPDQLVARIHELTNGRGVDVAFDYVGGAIKPLCVSAVGLFGRVVTIVEEPTTSPHNPYLPTPDGLFFKSASMHLEFLMSRAYLGKPESWLIYADQMRQINELLETGVLRLPRITNLGPMSPATVQEAHRRLESGHTQGKLVMTVAR